MEELAQVKAQHDAMIAQAQARLDKKENELAQMQGQFADARADLEQELAHKSQIAAKAEAERRIQVCKRVVIRMMRHQLAKAWDEFVGNMCWVKARREAVDRVLRRMLYAELAGAFACYAGHVERVRAQRERVRRTIARWRTPGIRRALDRWLGYVNMTRGERTEEARALALQALERKLGEQEACALALEEMRAWDARRRSEVCRRAIARMLQQHLAGAWTGLVQAVRARKRRRASVRRVLGRMQQRELAVAFACFCRGVEEQERVEIVCLRLFKQGRRVVVLRTFVSWRLQSKLAALQGGNSCRREQKLVLDASSQSEAGSSLYVCKLQDEKDRRIQQVLRMRATCVFVSIVAPLAGLSDMCRECRRSHLCPKQPQARCVVVRLLHSHLAGAFSSFAGQRLCTHTHTHTHAHTHNHACMRTCAYEPCA